MDPVEEVLDNEIETINEGQPEAEAVSPAKDEPKEHVPASASTGPAEGQSELEWRQKQIDEMKSTPCYLNYLVEVPVDTRGSARQHPVTPDPSKKSSRKLWSGLVKNWKKNLQKWDKSEDVNIVETGKAEILEKTEKTETINAAEKDDSVTTKEKTEIDEAKSTAENENPEGIQETDKPESILETDKPESILETDKPESILETDKPESIQATDELESIQETDKPETIKETNNPESTNKTDKVESINNLDKNIKETDKVQSTKETDKPSSIKKTLKIANNKETDKPSSIKETVKIANNKETDKPSSIKETDKAEILKRLKQLNLVKRTPHYLKYVQVVPRISREAGIHPKTPDATRKYPSRKEWLDEVNAWRGSLVKYEPDLTEVKKVEVATEKENQEIKKVENVKPSPGKSPIITGNKAAKATTLPVKKIVPIPSKNGAKATAEKPDRKRKPIVFDIVTNDKSDENTNGLAAKRKAVEPQKPVVNVKPAFISTSALENVDNQLIVLDDDDSVEEVPSLTTKHSVFNRLGNKQQVADIRDILNSKKGTLNTNQQPENDVSRPPPVYQVSSPRSRSQERRRRQSSSSSSESRDEDRDWRRTKSRSRSKGRRDRSHSPRPNQALSQSQFLPHTNLPGGPPRGQWPSTRPGYINQTHPQAGVRPVTLPMPRPAITNPYLRPQLPPPIQQQQQQWQPNPRPPQVMNPPYQIPPPPILSKPSYPQGGMVPNLPPPGAVYPAYRPPVIQQPQPQVSVPIFPTPAPATSSVQPVPGSISSSKGKGLDFKAIAYMNPGEEMLRYIQSKSYEYAREIDSKYPDFRRIMGRTVQNELPVGSLKVLPCGPYNKTGDCSHRGPENILHTGPGGMSIHACSLCYFCLGGMFNFHRQDKCPLLATF